MTSTEHSLNDTINEEVYDSSYEIQSWDDLNLNPKINLCHIHITSLKMR